MLEFVQFTSVIVGVFAAAAGLFNKPKRYVLYAVAAVLLGTSFAIHEYRLAYEPEYVTRMQGKPSLPSLR